MFLSLGLPTHLVEAGADLISAEAVTEMSRAAEAAGFDAVFTTDHPFPGDQWLAHGGHHTLDPMVTLSFAAAATTRLRLHTNLFVPAYRNPYLSAKMLSSLDALSGGRLILGVGAGYLEPEFAALGADFANRNDVLDDALRAMRAAWTGESVDGNTMRPRPAQNRIPVWVGGNSKRAIRRVVDLGDGWLPMPAPAAASKYLKTPGLETLDDLKARLDYAREYAESVGRTDPIDITFMPRGMSMFDGDGIDHEAIVADLTEQAEYGVTGVTLTLPATTRAQYLEQTAALGELVVPRVTNLKVRPLLG
ncbi:LLM class F420-dependent oxidoreductase [Streptomyces sp. SID3343]|uniref:LLM class F420-dependent oxidoreductase n=1 Tax=Streptomyces sp. SID3343 TaxID=2690260 RepID=UPI00136A27CA|nr:LLM class F420-dependent oxidoreductase [Streptomyces sp. SID3343]MYV96870.1 TIGR03619 family F420-dependent LLM class oxidoreductase [Streptomyces sp. SID3343]